MQYKKMAKKIKNSPSSKVSNFLDRDMLYLILSQMPEGVVIENQNHEIEFMNEPLKKLFGDKIGEKCYKAFVGRTTPCEVCSIDEIIKKKKKIFTYTVEDKNGRVYELVACPYQKPDGSLSVLEIIRDVTEKKKALEEIKYLKDFTKEIVDKLPIGVVKLDVKGIVLYGNPKMNEIVGLKKGEKLRSIGRKITEMPNVIQAGKVKILEKLLSGVPFKDMVAPNTSWEGKNTILSVSGVPLFKQDGNPNGALILVENVTEQKKTEAQLLRRNEELVALNTISKVTTQSLELEKRLRNTLDKILEVMKGDCGGIYLLDDKRLELDLAVKKNINLSFIKKRLKLGEGICGEVVKTGNPCLIREIKGDYQGFGLEIKDEKLCSFMGVPIKSKNEVLGVLFVGFKRIERFRKQQLDLLANIANHIGIAVENARLYKEAENWISQLETIRKITNRLNKINNVRTIAFSIAEEIKKVIEFDNCRVFLLDESGQNLFPVAFGSEVEEYKGETADLLRMKLGEGITGWVAEAGVGKVIDDVERHPKARHIPGTPFIDESMVAVPMVYEGKVRGVITLSKLGLRQFNQSQLGLLSILGNEAIVAVENARLFEDLKRAYSKLKTTQEQLIQSEKLNALGEMAGGVAHDFNNVLGAILGRAQLLHLSASDPKIKNGLSLIEKAAMDGAGTVRRIQEFTRVRADEAFVEININEMVKQSIEMTRHKWKDQAQEKGIVIEIKTELVKPDPVVAGDPSELRETFTNIILNALDAMPRGGKIKISSKMKGKSVLLSFADTGIGMSEEVKRKVFDPFFTTKGPKGSGLGMSVGYGIVIRHGGKIYLQSDRKEGTTFYIEIPIKKLPPAPSSEEDFALPQKKARILIIDDEPAIIDLLKEILELHDQKVATALEGNEGIEKFKKEKFDIVFTDLSMPEMSGWEVVRVLKELDPCATMVMITGWGTQLDSKSLEEEGIDLVVAKPFEVKKVLETVAQALNIKKERAKGKKLSQA